MKYTNVQLIFSEYYPEQLKKGMYFVTMHGLVQDNPYVHIYELDKIPRNQDEYIATNRPPVEPYLMMSVSSNPDVPPKVVASPDQIKLSVEEMNYCSARGYVEILTYDDGEPVLEKNGDVVFHIDQEFDDFDDDDDWEYDTFNNEEMI